MLLLTNKIALVFHRYKQTRDQIYLRLSAEHRNIVYKTFILQQLLVLLLLLLLLLKLSSSGRSRMLSDGAKAFRVPPLLSLHCFQSVDFN